jgi:hypothetical protein
MENHSTINSSLNAVKAMFIQISGLMWLRTATNYQYRYGLPIKDTFKNIYKDGGVLRFYHGYVPCLIMGSLCRFGDIYSLGLVNNKLKDQSLLTRTITTSSLSTFIRLNLIPLDNLDNMLQVEGKRAFTKLKYKINNYGLGILYYGGGISVVYNLIGNFSWFGTYNILNTNSNNIYYNGFVGLSCSLASDLSTNPLRILKLNKQTVTYNVGYTSIFKNIYQTHGLIEFWSRGLGIRIISHGIQSSLFVVLWKYIENLT